MERLDRIPFSVLVVAVCVMTAAAVCIDLLTPSSFELGLLYLPAIMLAGLRLGLPAAASVSLIAVFTPLLGRATGISAASVCSALTWLGTYAAIVALAESLRRSDARQRRLARTDLLTGLANRTALLERSGGELNRCGRSGAPVTVVYLDCDDFKQVNDRLGHLTGDRLLQTVADTLSTNIRSYDMAARPGGDEFVILLPDTSTDQARGVVERIRDNLLIAMRANNWNVTFSIGVATFCEPPPSADELIRAADELMYAVKRAGKNGVQFDVFGVKSLTE